MIDDTFLATMLVGLDFILYPSRSVEDCHYP